MLQAQLTPGHLGFLTADWYDKDNPSKLREHIRWEERGSVESLGTWCTEYGERV